MLQEKGVDLCETSRHFLASILTRPRHETHSPEGRAQHGIGEDLDNNPDKCLHQQLQLECQQHCVDEAVKGHVDAQTPEEDDLKQHRANHGKGQRGGKLGQSPGQQSVHAVGILVLERQSVEDLNARAFGESEKKKREKSKKDERKSFFFFLQNDL
jgi:hypothetical protein